MKKYSKEVINFCIGVLKTPKKSGPECFHLQISCTLEGCPVFKKCYTNAKDPKEIAIEIIKEIIN